MSDLVQTGSEMLSVDCATILTVLQWSEVAVASPRQTADGMCPHFALAVIAVHFEEYTTILEPLAERSRKVSQM